MDKCYHCKDVITEKNMYHFDDKDFCCNGCISVYTILNNSSALEYYDRMQDLAGLKPAEQLGNYEFLNHDGFVQEYYTKNSDSYSFVFYIEGVHCTACLWLLEKLNTFNSLIISSKLNMTDSTLKIKFSKQAKLSEIAQLIQGFGYTPHALLDSSDLKVYEKQEQKRTLMRIGVAFACSGNIMLYSFAIYLGAQGEFSHYFNLFSFFCTIPVVFYCAIPFYKSAYSSINSKVVSIDIPIVLVILSSFILGGLSLLYDLDFYYFDTISILIFLLLSSRFLLRNLNKKALSMESVSSFYLNQVAYKVNETGTEQILCKYLVVDDIVSVKGQGIVPADGFIVRGSSYLNNSAISGESIPVLASEGDGVFMGAINNTEPIQVRVSKISKDSRMGKILVQIENGWNKKNTMMTLIDNITKYFSLVLLAISIIFFLYFISAFSLSVAIDRTFSLLLITCPCALALSTPLAMILGLGAMLKRGIFVKDEKVLERLSQVENIFLDKTGTLTDGQFEVDLSRISLNDLQVIYSLENRSSHPIANSLCKKIKEDYDLKALAVTGFVESAGVGVSGLINSDFYELTSCLDTSSELNTISLTKNNEFIANLEVDDNLRPGAKEMVEFLKQRKINVHILSGDRQNRVHSIAKKLNICPTRCFSGVSPEGKADIIKASAKSLMLGDGMNDSSAIQQAFVGVAVNGSSQSSLNASDIYLSNSGIETVVSLFKCSDEIVYIIKRNLGFSLIYNVFGVYLAWSGFVSPVVAAIFMPVSSLTVLLSTIKSTRRINRLIN